MDRIHRSRRARSSSSVGDSGSSSIDVSEGEAVECEVVECEEGAKSVFGRAREKVELSDAIWQYP